MDDQKPKFMLPLYNGYCWYRRLYKNGLPGEWQICEIRTKDEFVDFFGEHSQPFFYRDCEGKILGVNRYLTEHVEFGSSVDKPGNLPE